MVLIEYRTVSTHTLKGLRTAERLHTAGWKTGSVGLFNIQYFRTKPTTNKPMRKKTTKQDSKPTCAFCKRSGSGITFAMFSPRFQPFGTACTECEATLPPGTANPATQP